MFFNRARCHNGPTRPRETWELTWNSVDGAEWPEYTNSTNCTQILSLVIQQFKCPTKTTKIMKRWKTLKVCIPRKISGAKNGILLEFFTEAEINFSLSFVAVRFPVSFLPSKENKIKYNFEMRNIWFQITFKRQNIQNGNFSKSTNVNFL